MSEAESDLRALAENVAADAMRLKQIEDEKGRIDPAHPRAARLAAEAERIARQIVPKAAAERELVDEARGT